MTERTSLWDDRFRSRLLRHAQSNDEVAQAVLEAEYAYETMTRYEEALRRLASAEGFEGAGVIAGDSFSERELRARMRFAEEALKA